jgi:hypothetical protein
VQKLDFVKNAIFRRISSKILITTLTPGPEIQMTGRSCVKIEVHFHCRLPNPKIPTRETRWVKNRPKCSQNLVVSKLIHNLYCRKE